MFQLQNTDNDAKSVNAVKPRKWKPTQYETPLTLEIGPVSFTQYSGIPIIQQYGATGLSDTENIGLSDVLSHSIFKPKTDP